MTQHALNLELPETQRLSIWPWLVALTAGVCLIVSLAQQLQSIPAQLQYSAQQFARNAGFGQLSISASGRDLTVSGNVEKQKSLANLLAGIEQIEGVRRVTDRVTIVDPVADTLAQRQNFLTSLSQINTASVAFEAGSSSFTQASDAALNQLARLMASNPDTRVRIEGHTDNTGPESVNLRLSRES